MQVSTSKGSKRAGFKRVADHRGLYTRRLSGGKDWYYLRSQKGGRTRWVNLHTTEKRVALRRYHEMAPNLGPARPARTLPTVRVYWDHARAHILRGPQKPRTLKGYEGNIDMILRGFKGTGKGACPRRLLDLRVDKFDDQCCADWFVIAFKVYGLSATKLQWVMWRKMFALAKKEDLISKKPDWHIPTRTAQGQERERRLKRGQDTRIRVPEASEFVQLVEDVKAHSTRQCGLHSANWILFVGCTGLRSSEANQLCWKDVDWDRGILHLPSRLKSNDKYDPYIHLTPPAQKALRAIHAAGATRRPDDTGCWRRVTIGSDQLRPSDRMLSVASPRKALAEACQRLGLPHLTLHGLRHFFASQCVRQGWDWATLAGALGHHDGGILAAGTYSHLSPFQANHCAGRWSLEPRSESLRSLRVC